MLCDPHHTFELDLFFLAGHVKNGGMVDLHQH